MAHSIQTVGDKAEVFNDLDLLVLVSLMTEELEHSADDYPLLITLASSWQACHSHYAPGMIDLDLDRAIATGDAREQFERLLAAVEQKVERIDDLIPAGELNSRLRVPGVTFNDYRPALLITAINKMRLLFRMEGRPRL